MAADLVAFSILLASLSPLELPKMLASLEHREMSWSDKSPPIPEASGREIEALGYRF
jgi:hypothetical protein